MLLVTCEHGGNRIPAEYREHFAGYDAALNSHRGHDPGALRLAQELAAAYGAPLVASRVSRLLVELNRSRHHHRLFSERTRSLSVIEKERIVGRYYEPYRLAVERRVAEQVAAGRQVLHVSCHTFTPVLDGVARSTDLGLLYDPARRRERAVCTAWAAALRARIAPLRVRRNYPYRGYDDGLTTWLRRLYPEDGYLGIEIEVNQKHVHARGRQWHALRRAIVQSLAELGEVTGVLAPPAHHRAAKATGGHARAPAP